MSNLDIHFVEFNNINESKVPFEFQFMPYIKSIIRSILLIVNL
ncbi:hypothetical protein C1A50_1088 [Paenibacillus polymyxa]|nr:hypothetical protein C1A50_1088 [Paenibacillus polymyxa]